jgi:hypothetical protein
MYIGQCVVASVKRKKSIELSKGESMPLYTREPKSLWKSIEVHGMATAVAEPVASENLCMRLRV